MGNSIGSSSIAGHSAGYLHYIAGRASPGIHKGGNPNGGAHYRERDACGKGHQYVVGSWSWEKDGSRRCLVCRSINQRRIREAKKLSGDYAKIREREKIMLALRRGAKRAGLTVEEFKQSPEGQDIVKPNALEKFILTPKQAAAQDAVGFAVDQKGRPKCEADPDAYSFDHDNIPSKEYAEAACVGCPLLENDVCLKRGRAGVGYYHVTIFGGKVFVDDKEVKEEEAVNG